MYSKIRGGVSFTVPETADSSEMREHLSTRDKLHHHIQVRVILCVCGWTCVCVCGVWLP